MPIDIVATGGSPYDVYHEEVVIDTHSTYRKAYQTAFNYLESCQCTGVSIKRNLEIRFKYAAPREDPPEDCPNPSPTMSVVSWKPPTTKESGEPLHLDEIAGYRVKRIVINNGVVDPEEVRDVGKVLSYEWPLPKVVHEFQVQTYDVDSQGSVFSGLVESQ